MSIPSADRGPPGNLAGPQQTLCGWLRRRYYEETGEALAAAAVLLGTRLHRGHRSSMPPERSIHVRVAAHAGRLYLDLADERWRAVEIGTEGWRVIATPPVRFRRPEGMLPLPEPRPRVRLEWLPRMADFALWATACETALWPAGFACAYDANRKAAIEDAIEADPVAAYVRELMAERSS